MSCTNVVTTQVSYQVDPSAVSCFCQCHLAIVVRWCVLGRLRPNAAHGEKPGHLWGSNIQSYEWVIGHVDGSGRALRVDRGRKCTGCGASYHNWYGPFKQKDENGNPHGLSEQLPHNLQALWLCMLYVYPSPLLFFCNVGDEPTCEFERRRGRIQEPRTRPRIDENVRCGRGDGRGVGGDGEGEGERAIRK